MEILLSGHMDWLGVALRHRYLSALLPCGHLADWPGLGGAGQGGAGLATEGVDLPGVGHCVWLMVPYLLTILATDVWHYEGDLLGHQLALLPCHGLTRVSARPLLVAIIISLPQGHTVLLGHIATLWQHLGVGNLLPALCTHLLNKLLGSQLGLLKFLCFSSQLAICGGHNLKNSFLK